MHLYDARNSFGAKQKTKTKPISKSAECVSSAYHVSTSTAASTSECTWREADTTALPPGVPRLALSVDSHRVLTVSKVVVKNDPPRFSDPIALPVDSNGAMTVSKFSKVLHNSDFVYKI
jgi:hypothetical protein